MSDKDRAALWAKARHASREAQEIAAEAFECALSFARGYYERKSAKSAYQALEEIRDWEFQKNEPVDNQTFSWTVANEALQFRSADKADPFAAVRDCVNKDHKGCPACEPESATTDYCPDCLYNHDERFVRTNEVIYYCAKHELAKSTRAVYQGGTNGDKTQRCTTGETARTATLPPGGQVMVQWINNRQWVALEEVQALMAERARPDNKESYEIIRCALANAIEAMRMGAFHHDACPWLQGKECACAREKVTNFLAAWDAQHVEKEGKDE